MICPLIRISLVSKAIKNYNKYYKYIFSNINHAIKNYYKKYPWFIKCDIAILTIEIFYLIPFVILLFIYLCTILCVYSFKEVDTISEKLKKREERKQRIKKYKEEIRELES